METTLRKEILSETYKDMAKLIFNIAWRFQLRHGGDIDDLISEANLLFINAFDEHDESRSQLSTWLTRYIGSGLWDYIKNERKRVHLSIEDKDSPQVFNPFSIMELLDEMGKDALIIVQLFLETPTEVILKALEGGKQMKHMRGYMRRRLRNRLRQMGWTVHRITKGFDEVRAAIQQ